ncbi:MAG: permease prefix domain 1-containing protein [Vicinamibacterales bacterium]
MAEWQRELEARCTAAALDAPLRDEVQREIAEHLDDRFDDLTAGGASAAEAARAVIAEIPSVEAIRRLGPHAARSSCRAASRPGQPRGRRARRTPADRPWPRPPLCLAQPA